jgi:hypothetical protein
VRRGGTALTVSLDNDAQIDTVSDILDECGAIDVDERVDRWRAGGYTGFDPSAPVYSDEDARRERERFQVVRDDVQGGKLEVPDDGVGANRRVSGGPVEEHEKARDPARRTGVEVESAMAAGGSDRPRETTSDRDRHYAAQVRRTNVDVSYRGPERRLARSRSDRS